MAEKNTLNIHQTLHGYRGGHKLLSCSVELSDIEKRTMLTYSDYSGSGIEKKFTTYITGYPLLFSKFYVFAKTWYADEMNRPGCVWTHSLLIDFTDLWAIENMATLLKLFLRPKDLNIYNEYAKSLLVPNETSPSNKILNTLFYQLACELYSNPEKGLVLLGDSSTEFEDEFLQIWNWQWPRMKRNFTFCTGSLSLRTYENQPFDLQVLPLRRRRSISTTETQVFNIIDLQKNSCENTWVKKYKSVNLKELQQFMVKYGSDVPGNKGNFVSLLTAYFIKNNNQKYTIDFLIDFFEKNFKEPTSAKQFKLDFIDAYLKSPNKNKFHIVELILHNPSFSNISWAFNNVAKSLWGKKEITLNQLSVLVNELISKNDEENIIDILKILQPKELLELDIPPFYISKLLEKCPQFEKEDFFWKADSESQNKWYEIIQISENTNWFNIISAMISVNSTTFAEKISEKIGIKLIIILLDWVSLNNKNLPSEWKVVFRENPQKFFAELTKHTLNKPILNIALETLNPYDSYWKNISIQSIDIFINSLNQTKFEDEITGIYTFFITAAYSNNLINPQYINNSIFQLLHDKLKSNFFDFNSWERFKWNMGKDLYDLIEQSYFSKIFKDRNKIPDWDRCEFLRRSLVVTTLKYNWDLFSMIEAVKDKNTFEKIVDFTLEINGGHKMLKGIYKELKISKKDSTFHFKILKSVFD